MILQGDALTRLRELPDESVNCCVTSPPYWGLRDYGADGQIGLEKTPEEYIARMVEVFREVRRVLKKDGTCWVNIGDSYAVASFLGQNNGGFADGNTGDGKPLDDPATTITGKGANQSLIASSMVKLRGTSTDADPCDPLDTVSAGGTHHGIAAGFLDQANNGFENRVGRGLDGPSPTICAFGSRAPLVAAFLNKFYGQGVGQELGEPGHTITAKDRFGLVTVNIGGEEMVMTDICMRMLQPRELYLAQGFPASYIIDRRLDGRPLNKTEQVRMCGNSVCPPVACALIGANIGADAKTADLQEAA